MEVPSEVLPKLVCDNCDGYLSRGPVHLMDNVRYRCGRCLPSEEEQGTRIEAYEELAKLMTFPCRYQHNGCPSKVSFVGNEAHEEACPYREYICPIAESGKCEWTGIQTELLEPCRQDHPDNVVENPCTFTHKITRFSLHNYLLWTLGVLFLIQTKICTATRKIYHSVRLIGDPARACNYKYTLCIQNKDSIFSKQREMAPRGCLALQNDSSIQTDINGLLTMMEDFTDTTFTVTVESVGNGTTAASTAASSSANTHNTTPVKTLEVSGNVTMTETSTAESSSQGTSSAHNTTPVEAIDVKVEDSTLTEPVDQGGRLRTSHAHKRRRCENSTKGCTYLDIKSKCELHVWYYCPYSTWCRICSETIPSTALDAHQSQAHSDITHRAGTVCSIRPVSSEKYLIIACDFGRAVCMYRLHDSHFELCVSTPVPTEQLCQYRCTVEIGGHTLQGTPTVKDDWPCDWFVQSDLNRHIVVDCNVNIKISISKIQDP